MGITPGYNAIAAFLRTDKLGIMKADKTVLELTNKARQKRRSQKRKKEEQDAENNQYYGPYDF